jgi:hypothetical protein
MVPDEWRSVTDVLTRTSPSDQPPGTGRSSTFLAVGTVVGVRAGASYIWATSEDGIPHQQEVGPNAENAWISTVYVDLELTDGSPPDRATPSKFVTFGLSFLPPADPSAVQRELQSHDSLAVVLVRAGAFPADPTVWDVLGDGDFLGFVDNGTVSFPVLKGTGIYPTGFVPAGLTVADLVRAAKP